MGEIARTKFYSTSTQMPLPMSARVLGAVCLLILLTLNLSPSTFQFQLATIIEQTNLPIFDPELKPNILDGCHHVYLDMGTNIGIQIRKLYEPQLFPDASMLPIFDKHFGPQTSGLRSGRVCAVGWEPNPAHTPALTRLEEAYNRCGWKVKIHKQTGVGAFYLNTQFKNMDFANKGDGIGGQIRDSWGAGDETTSVVTIRIADFINNVVATRRLPQGKEEGLPPAVIMKLDVEGKEMEVIPDLLLSGALAHVDTLHVDWHIWANWQDPEARATKEAIEFFTRLGNRYNISHVAQVDDMDDESYGDFSGDLPHC